MASVWDEYKRSEITAALTENNTTHVHCHRRSGKTRALLASPRVDLAQRTSSDVPRIVFVFLSQRTLMRAKAVWDEKCFEETNADGSIHRVDLSVPEETETVFMTFEGYMRHPLAIGCATHLYIEGGCFVTGIEDMTDRNIALADMNDVEFKVRRVCTDTRSCTGHVSCLVRKFLSHTDDAQDAK